MAAGAGDAALKSWKCPESLVCRGGILDVFPSDATNPVRIEFFGDEVESIRPFDAESQRSLDRWTTVTLTAPLNFDEADIASFGHAANTFPEEPGSCCWSQRTYARKGVIISAGSTTNVGYPRRGELRATYPLSHDRRVDAIGRFARNHVPLADRKIERFSGELTRVKTELENAAAGDNVLIACHNQGEVDRLGEVFSDTELAKSARLHLTLGRIRAGFHLIDARTLVIGDHELFARAECAGRSPVVDTRAGRSIASLT